MTGGRPRQFDEREALEAAMEVFWKKGFENTSCDDLMEAMDIRAGSMYATFGDKESLFEKAFDLYSKQVFDGALQILNGPGTPLENVRTLVEGWPVFLSDHSSKGCLVSNTLVEFGKEPTRIAKRARAMIEKKRALLQEKLEAAKKLGELPKEASPADMAAFLITTVQGLSVMSRSGADKATLQGVVNSTLKLLQ